MVEEYHVMEEKLAEVESIAIELQDNNIFLQKKLDECESKKRENYEELKEEFQKQVEEKEIKQAQVIFAYSQGVNIQ